MHRTKLIGKTFGPGTAADSRLRLSFPKNLFRDIAICAAIEFRLGAEADNYLKRAEVGPPSATSNLRASSEV